MTQLNASVLQLRLGLGLGLKFGYSSIDWDILYLLNTFLRYRQFKSVSDGHSAPNEKNRVRYVDNQTTNYKSNVEFIIAIKLHKHAFKIYTINRS